MTLLDFELELAMRDHDERARIPLGRCTTELIRDRCRRAAEDRFSLAVGTRRHSGVDRRFNAQDWINTSSD